MTVNSTFGSAIATVESYLPSFADTTKFVAQVAVVLTAEGEGRMVVTGMTVFGLSHVLITGFFARCAYNAPTLKARVRYGVFSMVSAALAASSFYAVITTIPQDGEMIPKCETLLAKGEELLAHAKVTNRNDWKRFDPIAEESSGASVEFLKNKCKRFTGKIFPSLQLLMKECSSSPQFELEML